MAPSPQTNANANPVPLFHTRRSLNPRDIGHILVTITLMTVIILTGLAIYIWRHPETTFWAWKARRSWQRETAVLNSSSEHSLAITLHSTSTSSSQSLLPNPKNVVSSQSPHTTKELPHDN